MIRDVDRVVRDGGGVLCAHLDSKRCLGVAFHRSCSMAMRALMGRILVKCGYDCF